jgi:hypothetical protein
MDRETTTWLACRLIRESFLSAGRYAPGFAVFQHLPEDVVALWEAGQAWVSSGPWEHRPNRDRFVRVVVWRHLRQHHRDLTPPAER